MGGETRRSSSNTAPPPRCASTPASGGCISPACRFQKGTWEVGKPVVYNVVLFIAKSESTWMLFSRVPCSMCTFWNLPGGHRVLILMSIPWALSVRDLATKRANVFHCRYLSVSENGNLFITLSLSLSRSRSLSPRRHSSH